MDNKLLIKGYAFEKARAASGRKKHRHDEDALQLACVRWFDYEYPRLSQLLFHIRNGGKVPGGAREGARWKAMGVRRGVPDLFLSVPEAEQCGGGHVAHGLYIELKTPNGRQTEEQKGFAQAARAVGYKYAVVRSIDEFMNAINEYLLFFREKV